MNIRLIAFVVVLALVGIALPAQSQIQQGNIQMTINSEETMLFDYLFLTVNAYENNSVLLEGTATFDVIGIDKSIEVIFNKIGNQTSASGTVSSDIFYVVRNNSKDYVVSNLATFQTNVTITEESLEYRASFNDVVSYAKDNFFKNESLENIGIRATFSFEAAIQNVVGTVSQKRFLSITIAGNTYIPISIFDFTVPQNADITDATNEDKDMQKSGAPYKVSTRIDRVPFNPVSGTLYLGWQIISEPIIWTLFPYNLIVTILISLTVGWLGRYAYDKVKLGREKKQAEPVVKALLQRISDHCALLMSHLSLLAFAEPKTCSIVADYVKESKDSLLQYVNELAKDPLSLKIKKAILELDRQLDLLINTSKARQLMDDKMWLREVTDTLSRLAHLSGLVGNEGARIGAEALHDLYLEKAEP
jgi:hypothetical protein